MTPSEKAKELLDYTGHISPYAYRNALQDLYDEHMRILPGYRAWMAWQANTAVSEASSGGIL